MRTWIRPFTLVLLFLIVYLGLIFFSNERDPKTFVTLGTCFSVCEGADGEHCPLPNDASDKERLEVEGYDGQFNYYIARDPSHAAPCIDVPPYRYQRILLPLLGRLFSAGRADAIPLVFVLLNGLAHVGATYLLERLLLMEGRSRWFALSYGLYFGLVIAVRLSTNEPLAYALVVLAIWFYKTERFIPLALALGLAGFGKETTSIVTAGFLLWFILQRRWREALLLILLAGIPFVLWQLYLYNWLGDFALGSGGAKGTPFVIIPFGGLLQIALKSLPAFLLLGVVLLGPPVVLPTLWGLWRSWRDARTYSISLYTCLLFSSALIMLFVPFSTYSEFLGIFRFIPALVLMLVLYSAERNIRRPLMYSTLYIVLLMFLSVG